jgi:hypothetical protein
VSKNILLCGCRKWSFSSIYCFDTLLVAIHVIFDWK